MVFEIFVVLLYAVRTVLAEIVHDWDFIGDAKIVGGTHCGRFDVNLWNRWKQSRVKTLNGLIFVGDALKKNADLAGI